jgi:hypothetical protein
LQVLTYPELSFGVILVRNFWQKTFNFEAKICLLVA